MAAIIVVIKSVIKGAIVGLLVATIEGSSEDAVVAFAAIEPVSAMVSGSQASSWWRGDT